MGLTKRSLRKALGRSKTSNKELITIVCEIEALLNSRPLTHVDADITSRQVLTPSHFLTLNVRTGCPDAKLNDDHLIDTSSELVATWKNGQTQINNFWNIWLTDYLQSLRERKSYKLKPVKGEVRRKPRIGEIVIVQDKNQPRGKWKIAKVDGLVESDVDKRHRAAKLLLPSGYIIKRPFRMIYPLEMNDDENDVD